MAVHTLDEYVLGMTEPSLPRRALVAATSALRDWMPPRLHRAFEHASGRSIRFVGGWSDWAAASAASRGYDDVEILARVVRATREVEAGRSGFERDSVLFSPWQPPFRLLGPLLRHALRHDGRLDVVDFGGSLGSAYRHCLPFLPALNALQWHVVEQPGFVAAGRAEFSSTALDFHESLASLPPAVAPRLLLASSVLQYLPAPTQWLDDWDAFGVDTLVLDRTPVWDGPDDVPCVQHVPRHIYPASYPFWVLSRPRLLKRFERHWRLLCEFDCPEGQHVLRGGSAFEFKGFVWERKTA